MSRLWLRLALGMAASLFLLWVLATVAFDQALRPTTEAAMIALLRPDIEHVQAHEGFDAADARALAERRGIEVRVVPAFDGLDRPTMLQQLGEFPVVAVPVGSQAVLLGPPGEIELPWSTLFGLLGVLTVAVSLVGWGLGGTMVREMEALGQAARRFGDGDLTARSGLTAHDEVGRVGQQFDRMADRIAELLQGHDHLLQAVSHELRTPAARIRFGLELLEGAGTADERHRLIASIDDDVTELDELIEELLSFVRLQRGLTPGARRAFSVAQPTRDMVADLADLHGEVAFDVAVDDDVVLSAVPHKYTRVVRNLVGNAARHARSTVQVHVEANDAWVVLTVDDDGPGVPVAQRARVFQPFVHDPQKGGTGLGLALVERIVRAHGGDVAVGDGPLGGARFVTTWPLRPGGGRDAAAMP